MNSVERIKQLEKEIESERRNIQTCMHAAKPLTTPKNTARLAGDDR